MDHLLSDDAHDFLDTAHVPPAPDATLVQTGLLTAFVAVRGGQRFLLAPLSYDLDVVLAEGSITVEDGMSTEDALTDWYGVAFQDWCARKEAERAVNAPTIRPTRTMRSAVPTPDHSGRFVPFSWMGRDPSFVR